jgi:hypothetical protein
MLLIAWFGQQFTNLIHDVDSYTLPRSLARLLRELLQVRGASRAAFAKTGPPVAAGACA